MKEIKSSLNLRNIFLKSSNNNFKTFKHRYCSVKICPRVCSCVTILLKYQKLFWIYFEICCCLISNNRNTVGVGVDFRSLTQLSKTLSTECGDQKYLNTKIFVSHVRKLLQHECCWQHWIWMSGCSSDILLTTVRHNWIMDSAMRTEWKHDLITTLVINNQFRKQLYIFTFVVNS